jgi:hypothetical protein
MFRRENAKQRTERRSGHPAAPFFKTEVDSYELLGRPLAVVVVVIPIAFRAPAMPVFIPPTFVAVPALLACLTQLSTRMLRLSALAAVMLDGVMKTMIGLGDTSLASAVIRAQTRRPGEKQEPGEHSTREHCFTQPKCLGLKFCLHPSLLSPGAITSIADLNPSPSGLQV